MPRNPRGKRIVTADGDVSVAAKNPNGDGSIYFETARVGADGKETRGRWRATYRDEHGHLRRVQGATRAKVEQRRDERLAAIERMPMRNSRFSPGTTVAELTDWWLDSVARHQVRTSTLDSYRKFAGYLSADLGSLPVVDVGAETLTTWQSTLLDRFAPYTVLNCRKVCRQAFAEAVKVGLIPSNPFDLVRAPRGKRVSAGRALSTNEAKALITAAQSLRLGAAVTLLFVQGWRVSEVLGLAWEDLDLDAGTAQIRRGAAYTPSVGTVLGSTKTSGAEGIHYLAPISVAHLRQRRAEQEVERERLPVAWPVHQHDGIALSMVFTTTHGGLVNRQSVTKEIERAAKIAGLDPTGLASHSGRRTVITALYADGRLDQPTSLGTSATPTRPRPPNTYAASGSAPPTPLAEPPNSSTQRCQLSRSRRRVYLASRKGRDAVRSSTENSGFRAPLSGGLNATSNRFIDQDGGDRRALRCASAEWIPLGCVRRGGCCAVGFAGLAFRLVELPAQGEHRGLEFGEGGRDLVVI